MKKLIVAVVMGFGFLSASAQNKIAYINTDDLIQVMPEAARADSALKEFQASLVQQGEDMGKELDEKVSVFNKDSLKFTPSMKDIKRSELTNLYQRLSGWNQQAQEMYQAEAQKKIAPIRSKAMEAIQSVAKENGYTYVFDINSLLVYPPADDLLPLVKRKLNIKDTPSQKAPATTPKKG